MNAYLILSSLLTLLVAFFFIVVILRTDDRSALHHRFLYFLLSVALWSACYFLWRISSTEANADLFCRLLTAFSILIPITAYHFSLVLADLKVGRSVAIGYALAGLLIVLLPSELIVGGVSEKFGHSHWPDAGPLTWAYLTFFFGYLFASGWALLRGWKLNIGGRATGQIFILATCFLAFFGGATNFPLWYDIPIQPYGNLMGALYVFLWGCGIFYKKRGLGRDFYKFAVGLSACFSGTLLFLLITSFSEEASLSLALEGSPGWIKGLFVFFVSTALFWGVPQLKSWIDGMVDGVFRKDLPPGLSELRKLPSELTELRDAASVYMKTEDKVKRAMEVSDVAIFAMEDSGEQYVCKAVTGGAKTGFDGVLISQNDPLVVSMAANPRCLVLDSLSEDVEQSLYRSLLYLRNLLKTSLIVPIFINNEIYGLILLGSRLNRRNWGNDELAVLLGLGAQIGIHVKTGHLEEMVKNRTAELEQRNLELVEANRAKQDFLASVSHEIRNPLQGILGITKLLLEDGSLSAEQSRIVSHLTSCREHLDKLVTPVLTYTSLEAGVFKYAEETFDVAEIVDSVVAIHASSAEAKGLSIQVEIPDINGLWLGAATALRQVLVNLVSNAVKYTNIGGVKIRLVYQQEGNTIAACFVIHDSGSGIPRDQQEFVFRQFTRLSIHEEKQIPGTGLGLAIARRLAELMNGSLRIDNNVESGACFVMELPFRAASVEGSESDEGEPDIHGMVGKRVLIADDMEFNLFINRVMLERFGLVVSEAMNGENALEMLREGDFDLAIIDVNMPGLNGIEVVKAYRAHHSQTGGQAPIFIALSAHTTSKISSLCLQAGFDRFIEKPLEPATLAGIFESGAPGAYNTGLLDYLSEACGENRMAIEKRYRATLARLASEIQRAASDRDWDSFREATHRFRGVAAINRDEHVLGPLSEARERAERDDWDGAAKAADEIMELSKATHICQPVRQDQDKI